MAYLGCSGAELRYSRSKRCFKLSMQTYIEKLADKFNVRAGSANPNFVEPPILNEQSAIVNFPYREMIGSLQWISTITRPDVARNVNFLSRFLGKPVTMARVDAGKKIIKYLLSSLREGISYSPSNEEAFLEDYSEDGDGHKMPKSAHHLFNDASFASSIDNYYSNSGSVLFVHGTPIAWRSGRQTIRATSTTEAEWIAASDGLTWVKLISCLEFFSSESNISVKLPKDMLILRDNKSAVIVAKCQEIKPKSRHYALRMLNVRDEKARLWLVRTDKMCADALTKPVSGKQRKLLLGKSSNIPISK